MPSNLPLVWVKTETGYEAKSAFGHYQAHKDGRKFHLQEGSDDTYLGYGLLHKVKETAQNIDDIRYNNAQIEAFERDAMEYCRCGELLSNCWCDGRRPDLEMSREEVEEIAHPEKTADRLLQEERHTRFNSGDVVREYRI